MFSLASVVEKLVSLSLSHSHSLTILIGCQCEQPAVAKRENSDYKALFREDVVFARLS